MNLRKRLLALTATLGLLVGALGVGVAPVGAISCTLPSPDATHVAKTTSFTRYFLTNMYFPDLGGADVGAGTRWSQYKLTGTGCYNGLNVQSLGFVVSYVSDMSMPNLSQTVTLYNGKMDYRSDRLFQYFPGSNAWTLQSHMRLKLSVGGTWSTEGTLVDHVVCGNHPCSYGIQVSANPL